MGLPPFLLPEENQDNNILNQEDGDKEIRKLILASQKIILSFVKNKVKNDYHS